MNRPIRAFTSLLLALCLALMPLAGVASAAEEPTIDYKPISEAEFAKDLAGKKVRSVEVNKRLRTLRVTLTDGSYVLAHYPPHEEPATVARLKANGVTVTILGKSSAEKEAKAKPAHHKIRYIVGGVVILVIIVVGVVLLVNRRRQQD
jgi:ATP-dependent Zn protease